MLLYFSMLPLYLCDLYAPSLHMLLIMSVVLEVAMETFATYGCATWNLTIPTYMYTRDVAHI